MRASPCPPDRTVKDSWYARASTRRNGKRRADAEVVFTTEPQRHRENQRKTAAFVVLTEARESTEKEQREAFDAFREGSLRVLPNLCGRTPGTRGTRPAQLSIFWFSLCLC